MFFIQYPGNPYPVVEHPTDTGHDGSLLGKIITPGYQSHYVLTTKDGMPCKKKLKKSRYYDEIVVNQEAQVGGCFTFNSPRCAPLQ